MNDESRRACQEGIIDIPNEAVKGAASVWAILTTNSSKNHLLAITECEHLANITTVTKDRVRAKIGIVVGGDAERNANDGMDQSYRGEFSSSRI